MQITLEVLDRLPEALLCQLVSLIKLRSTQTQDPQLR